MTTEQLEEKLRNLELKLDHLIAIVIAVVEPQDE